MKITIIYDSLSGNTRQMAHAVAEGAGEIKGIDIIVKHVDSAVGEDLLSEGLIIGSPAYCGLLTWKLKQFFDTNTNPAWGKVNGHIGAAFSSSGGLGGGNEMTVMSILNILLNFGYLVFGLTDYTSKDVTAHYGAVSVRTPGEAELEACRLLGKRTAEYVKRMFA